MIRVGTCGYSRYKPDEQYDTRPLSLLQAYTYAFEVGELNRTFYQLPRVNTAARWRLEAAPAFEFTLKVWQAITHSAESPTWRRFRQKLSEGQRLNFGRLRMNPEVLEAWESTRKIAEALKAKICVFQTPTRFGADKENEKNLRRFFSEVDRGDLDFAWEPRGSWNERPELVRNLCAALRLIHVVDPMRRKPLSDSPVSYFRLHGLNKREYDYSYDYAERELIDLAARLKAFERDRERVYCMFNNFEMYKNAKALRAMLEEDI